MEKMNGSIPRPEYPRPRLMRPEDTWVNLNGKWEFEFDFGESGFEQRFFEKEHFSKEIVVPFVPESELSGIGYTDFMKSVWYLRTFEVRELGENERVLLHFGAVDNYARVFINGVQAGEHRGGFTPFCLDITALVNTGKNTVVLNAVDDTRDPLQPSGKQSHTYANQGCFYTRCTGIWQTVWLEYVPETYIKNVKIIPDPANEKADVTVIFDGRCPADEVYVNVSFEGEPVCEKTVKVTGSSAVLSVEIPSPKLWDIGKGNLYDMTVCAGDDMVVTYFGMRSTAVCGHKYLLNGKSVFQRLVLDQGYFEKGIYTAESDEELIRDIELSMSCGFNGARMHMKVFEPRFIYHADRMGYLLWGEYPNWGLDATRPGAFGALVPGWREQMERDMSNPSVIGWCPLNETWCSVNEFTRNLYFLTKTLDPSRPVIDVSGYFHSEFTDIYDVHDYEQNADEFKKHYAPLMTGEGEVFINFPDKEKRDPGLPYFVSEFGGAFWDDDAKRDEGRDMNTAWGYGERPETADDFYERLDGLVSVLLDNSMICGFCYTQLTDVMQEKNGLFTFSRKPKFDCEKICGIIGKKAAAEE